MAIQITPLPTPPTRQDPENFSARGDAFLGALPLFQSELNLLAVEVEDNNDSAALYAATAGDHATRAETAATSAEGDRLAAEQASQSASSSATNAASSANTATSAAISASADAIRAEDAADRAEAIVGPVGTAAFADVQTSPTDTTPGALMAAGAFGLGGGTIRLMQPDLNESRPSGFYYCESPINQPPSAGDGYLDQVDLYAGLYFKQKYVAFGANVRIWERQFIGVESNPQYQPWEEIWHTGNQLPLGTTPISAREAIQWHLGADIQQTIPAATGSVTLNMDAYSVFDLVLVGATTLIENLSYLPSNGVRSVVIRVRQGAVAQTLTWWGGITWLTATTPAAPGANKIVEYVISYSHAGWIGRVGAKNQ